MKRRHLPAVALLGMAMFAGCSAGAEKGGQTTATSSSSVALDQTAYNPQPYENLKDGGTLTAAGSFSGDDTQGNPFNVNGTLTASRIWNQYNAMAITFSPTGEVQVNKDYYTSATSADKDGKQVVTLTINPNANFNDGTPIDWTVVQRAWQVLSGKEKGYQIGATNGWDQIESVAKGADERQAVITFAKPYAAWPSLFMTFLHPKATTPEAFNSGYSNKLHPEWGVGPFTVESYDPNSKKLVLVRNPKWWGRTAKLERRVLIDLPNAQAAVNAFKNGQIDIASATSAESLNQLKGVEGAEMRQGGSPFQYYLFANGKSPILSDPTVRKAVMAAVDREQIAKIQFQGMDYTEPLPGSAVFFTFQDGYEDNLSKVLTPGAEEANKILDEAGWKPGADGIREKEGKRLSIGYTLFGDDPVEKATAASLVAAQKKAGIEVKIQNTNASQWASTIKGSKFDLVISGNRALDPYGSFGLSNFYGSTSPNNITKVGTKEIDAEITKVNEIPDAKEQIKQANLVEQKALAQYGMMPLFSGPSTYAVKKDLANVGATLLHTPLPETIGYVK